MAGASAEHLEVEVKARVDDLDALRQTLLDRGARPITTARERDTYYAHPARSFAQTDEALRLRRIGDRAELTYKGPKLDAATKTRREIDLPVDGERAAALLDALGFSVVAEVIKRRESLRLEDTTITLDDVEDVGTFAEIERLATPEVVDDVRTQVIALADSLGLTDRTTTSYLELLLDARARASGSR